MVVCVWLLVCVSVGGGSGAVRVSWTWMSVRWGCTAVTRTLAASTFLDGTPATACLDTLHSWQTTVTSFFVKVSTRVIRDMEMHSIFYIIFYNFSGTM